MTATTAVLVAGVGGQGVLTVARVLGEAALADGLAAVVGQQHGMAQRGGSVRAPVVLGHPGGGGVRTAHLPAGRTDLLLGLDPLECARALPELRPGGVVLVCTPGFPLQGAPSTASLLSMVAERCARVVRVDAGQPHMAGPAALAAVAALGLLPLSTGAIHRALASALPSAAVRAFERATWSELPTPGATA